MKTIKELEAEINLNKNFDLNNWKEDKTFDVGYREALKDVLGLIDEMQRYGSNGLKMIYYIDGDELKARITGK